MPNADCVTDSLVTDGADTVGFTWPRSGLVACDRSPPLRRLDKCRSTLAPSADSDLSALALEGIELLRKVSCAIGLSARWRE